MAHLHGSALKRNHTLALLRPGLILLFIVAVLIAVAASPTVLICFKSSRIGSPFSFENFAIGSAVVCTGIGSSIDSDHRTASCVLMRSVTSMAPGAWVMANEGFAAAITACGVTPQAQNTGSSSLAIATASP